LNDLLACPCGAVPEELFIRCGSTHRWRYVSGDCCGEWEIEARVPVVGEEANLKDQQADACARAWNNAPRAS
jgi:hypothetical protein